MINMKIGGSCGVGKEPMAAATRTAAVLLLLSLSSCGAARELPDEARSRTYRAPMEETFAALVSTLNEMGYTTEKRDLQRGFISTRQKSGEYRGIAGISFIASVKPLGSDNTNVYLTALGATMATNHIPSGSAQGSWSVYGTRTYLVDDTREIRRIYRAVLDELSFHLVK